MTTGEQRFRSGDGQKYMNDGYTVRCQALAKAKVRRLREQYQDTNSPADRFWPEAQCSHPAVPNGFICRLHGGETPSTNPKTFLDVLPFDLREKMKIIMANPDYISRREDINLMLARRWQLIEELEDYAGSAEAWGMVSEAIVLLKTGELNQGIALLERASESTRQQKEIWDEVYKVESSIKDLTQTQVRTAKELRQMATTEQVNSLILSIQRVFEKVINHYVLDQTLRGTITRQFVGELLRLNNAGTIAVSGQLTEGTESS
jgi:predicted Zn-dependent protease